MRTAHCRACPARRSRSCPTKCPTRTRCPAAAAAGSSSPPACWPASTHGERRALFAHERAHLAGRHHRFLLAVQLAARANPFLRPLCTAVAYTTERWADEEAARVTATGATVARAVGKAALVSRGTRTRRSPGFAAPGPVPRRVAALLEPGTVRTPLAAGVHHGRPRGVGRGRGTARLGPVVGELGRDAVPRPQGRDPAESPAADQSPKGGVRSTCRVRPPRAQRAQRSNSCGGRSSVKQASRTTACSVLSKSPSAPPMTMPIWMTARASAGFFLALAISCRTLTLPKAKSAVELVEVLVEAPLQVLGGEVLQHLVGGDQLGDPLPLRRVDGAVGGGDQGAHRHARVAEGAALEVVLLRLELGLHRRCGLLEAVPQGHGELHVKGGETRDGPATHFYNNVETSSRADEFRRAPSALVLLFFLFVFVVAFEEVADLVDDFGSDHAADDTDGETGRARGDDGAHAGTGAVAVVVVVPVVLAVAVAARTGRRDRRRSRASRTRLRCSTSWRIQPSTSTFQSRSDVVVTDREAGDRVVALGEESAALVGLQDHLQAAGAREEGQLDLVDLVGVLRGRGELDLLVEGQLLAGAADAPVVRGRRT